MSDGLTELLAAVPRERNQALPALHLLHDGAGYLPAEGLEEIAAWLFIPRAELYAVATSYSEFRMAAAEEGTVRVCRGLSCRIAGSEALATALREGGRPVEECECLFACAVAPVLETEGIVLGRASANAVTL